MNELTERIANAKFEDTPLLLGRLYRHRGFYPKAEKILEQHLRECEGHKKDSIRKFTKVVYRAVHELTLDLNVIVYHLTNFDAYE